MSESSNELEQDIFNKAVQAMQVRQAKLEREVVGKMEEVFGVKISNCELNWGDGGEGPFVILPDMPAFQFFMETRVSRGGGHKRLLHVVSGGGGKAVIESLADLGEFALTHSIGKRKRRGQ